MQLSPCGFGVSPDLHTVGSCALSSLNCLVSPPPGLTYIFGGLFFDFLSILERCTALP